MGFLFLLFGFNDTCTLNILNLSHSHAIRLGYRLGNESSEHTWLRELSIGSLAPCKYTKSCRMSTFMRMRTWSWKSWVSVSQAGLMEGESLDGAVRRKAASVVKPQERGSSREEGDETCVSCWEQKGEVGGKHVCWFLQRLCDFANQSESLQHVVKLTPWVWGCLWT